MIKNFPVLISEFTSKRLRHPIGGVYVFSWILSNWNHLILLFFGQERIDERVNNLYLLVKSSWFTSFNSFFWLPLFLTAIYLLVFPWFVLGLKHIQKIVEDRLHKQSVEKEISYYGQEERLNIARVRADPNKRFIDQLVETEIEKEKDNLELKKAKIEQAEAIALELEEKAETIKIEEKAKRKKIEAEISRSDAEKAKFEANAAIHRSSQAANRFPVVFELMSLLERSLENDNIIIPLAVLSDLVATVFGYKNIKSLLADSDFTNCNFEKVKFIYYESSELFSLLSKEIPGQGLVPSELTVEMLFDHIVMTFDTTSYSILESESLKEMAMNYCYSNRYEFFQCEIVANEMANTNTIYDEIEFNEADDYEYNDDEGFIVTVTARASGSHYKENVPTGQDITLTINMVAPIVLGKFGLGDFVVDDIKAELVYE